MFNVRGTSCERTTETRKGEGRGCKPIKKDSQDEALQRLYTALFIAVMERSGRFIAAMFVYSRDGARVVTGVDTFDVETTLCPALQRCLPQQRRQVPVLCGYHLKFILGCRYVREEQRWKGRGKRMRREEQGKRRAKKKDQERKY